MKTPLSEFVGARIRLMREARGLTQKDLAVELGLTRTSITNMESGLQPPILEHVYSIAEALGIRAMSLLPEMTPQSTYSPQSKRKRTK